MSAYGHAVYLRVLGSYLDISNSLNKKYKMIQNSFPMCTHFLYYRKEPHQRK